MSLRVTKKVPILAVEKEDFGKNEEEENIKGKNGNVIKP